MSGQGAALDECPPPRPFPVGMLGGGAWPAPHHTPRQGSVNPGLNLPPHATLLTEK